MKWIRHSLAVVALVCLAMGCAPDDKAPVTGGTQAVELPATFVLTAAPEGAKPLTAVKADARVGDRVTFKCRIGGRKKAFVDNRAIMYVIDPALPSCADHTGDECQQPWDYCCETPETKTANMATVQVIGNDGKPLALSLRDQPGIKELAWITIVGDVAERSDDGVFLVNASGVFIEKQG